MQAFEQDGTWLDSVARLQTDANILGTNMDADSGIAGPIQCSTCASSNWQAGEGIYEVLSGYAVKMMELAWGDLVLPRQGWHAISSSHEHKYNLDQALGSLVVSTC